MKAIDLQYSSCKSCIYRYWQSSFTIVEMIIAVSLTALILAYLYQSMHGVDRANLFYQQKITDQENKQALQMLLYNDILQSDTNSSQIAIKDSNNVFTFTLRGSYSIKNSFYPYTNYVFYKKEQILFRLETILPITLPIKDDVLLTLPYNKFVNIEHFEIIASNQKKESFLIYYTTKGEKSLFEVKKI